MILNARFCYRKEIKNYCCIGSNNTCIPKQVFKMSRIGVLCHGDKVESGVLSPLTNQLCSEPQLVEFSKKAIEKHVEHAHIVQGNCRIRQQVKREK